LSAPTVIPIERLPSSRSDGFTFNDRLAQTMRRLAPCLLLALAGCAIHPRLAPTTVPLARVEAMLRVADAEWRRWGQQLVRLTPEAGSCAVLADGSCRHVDDGCGREMSAALCPRVNDYWRALKADGRGVARQRCGRTDVCEAAWPTEFGAPEPSPPWSAAFIGAVLREAGFREPEFAFAAAHAQYIVAARDRQASAFDVVAVPTTVDVGDLVCMPRGGGAASARPMTLDEIRAGRDVVTPMHCDLVVALDLQAHTLEAIGGNVQQSVARSVVPLAADNRLDWSPDPERGWILAMKPHRDYTPLRR
jgi:hypothetical protein